MKKVICILIAMIPLLNYSQNKLSVVTLKNGTELKGTIKSIVPTDSLVIIIAGIETPIKMANVAKVEEEKECLQGDLPQKLKNIEKNSHANEVETPVSFVAISGEQRLCFNVLSRKDKTVEVTYRKNVKYNDSHYLIPSKIEFGGDTFTIVAIGKEAFCRNNHLTTIELPNTITEIGPEAFKGCSKLKQIEFATGLKKIGEEAFQYCMKLENVYFPMGVEEIGEQAFASCIKIKNVELPQGLIRIEEQAFQACPLERIDIPNTVTYIGRRAFFSANVFIGQESKIKWLSIPESVMEIGKQAFCKFINLMGTAFPSKCQIGLLPSWLDEKEASRIGISEDSYWDYKNRIE